MRARALSRLTALPGAAISAATTVIEGVGQGRPAGGHQNRDKGKVVAVSFLLVNLRIDGKCQSNGIDIWKLSMSGPSNAIDDLYKLP